MKNVLITTKHRGVFYAELDEATDLTQTTLQNLKNCRMAIRFGTTRGLMQLASDGPTQNSKIGASADVDVIHNITAIFSVSDKAAEAWRTA